MDFEQFYPTPTILAERLVTLIDNKVKGVVLEPSAGNGDLADELFKRLNNYWSKFSSRNIHCVEINPQRAAVLRDKGYSVVWDDFLTFNPLIPYSLIIMNPPFRDGAKHLLKALQILAPGGELVCILNAETIRNPYTNERKDLIRRLEEMEHFTADFQQDTFLESERPADVEVALIHVKKKAAPDRCITFDGFKKSIADEHQEEFQAVARHGEINGLIDNYRAEVQTALRLFDEITNFNRISLYKGKDSYNAVFDIKINHGNNCADIVRAINRNYWTLLLHSEEIARLLPNAVCRRYSSKIHEMAEFEFNERNILQLKTDLTKDLFANMDEAVMNVWNTFTSRFAYAKYSQNIHYYNGWITNKAYKVNRKVIIPLNAFSEWGGEYSMRFSQVNSELGDIEKVMTFLDGGLTEDTNVPNMFDRLKHACDHDHGLNRNIDTKFFTVRLYKKGTAHLTFKSEILLKKFNLYCGKKFNWLPDDYGSKRYEDLTAKEKEVADSFEGKESYQDTFEHQDFYLPQPSGVLMLNAGK